MAYEPQDRERDGATDPSADEGAVGSGPLPEPLCLGSLELSLSHASLDALEAATRGLSADRFAQVFERSTETAEAVLLSTCHRVELLLLLRSPSAMDEWRSALPDAGRGWIPREGLETVQHLFRVTAGLESLARGETEVRDQVAAVRPRVLSRYHRPVLRTLLDEAVGAAGATLGGSADPPSVASIGVARLREVLPKTRPHVLVVGSGTVGREVVASLGPDARVTIAFHARPPEPEYLAAHRARAVAIGRLREELPHADAVVTAAKFGGRGLRAQDLPAGKPMTVLDLGQPRNVDPAVRTLPGVRLIDLEELYQRALPARAPDQRDRAVDERARDAYRTVEGRLQEPWVAAFRRAAERIRAEELAAARRFFGSLSPEQEQAVERLTARLVSRLLAAPTERLRSLPADADGARLRRLAWELYGPRPADP